MSVHKLNKTAKSLYDDIVRIRAETKLEENFRNRPKNLKNSNSNPITNDIALNTVMRQMMDMIKESNGLISELSGKVRNQDIKIGNLEQTVNKLQTGYRTLETPFT